MMQNGSLKVKCCSVWNKLGQIDRAIPKHVDWLSGHWFKIHSSGYNCPMRCIERLRIVYMVHGLFG